MHFPGSKPPKYATIAVAGKAASFTPLWKSTPLPRPQLAGFKGINGAAKREGRDGKTGGSAGREGKETRFAYLKFLHPSLFTVTYCGPLDHGVQYIMQW